MMVARRLLPQAASGLGRGQALSAAVVCHCGLPFFSRTIAFTSIHLYPAEEGGQKTRTGKTARRAGHAFETRPERAVCALDLLPRPLPHRVRRGRERPPRDTRRVRVVTGDPTGSQESLEFSDRNTPEVSHSRATGTGSRSGSLCGRRRGSPWYCDVHLL
jgi:hypothetical protein